MQISQQFLTRSQENLLKLSLSLRVYSPKIEAFRQIAEDRGILEDRQCKAVVDVNGILTCSIDEMKELISKGGGSKPPLYAIDHRYPGAPDVPSLPAVVLYAALGSAEFSAFHQALKDLQSSGKAEYILRPYAKPDASSRKVDN